ncbi:hypothetical protein JHK84_045323 [Glycine max]|nr:hypothetical protein JHK84_045323 [Glycine max]
MDGLEAKHLKSNNGSRFLECSVLSWASSLDATTLRSESYKTNRFEFQHEAESIASDTERVTSGSSSGEGIRGSRGLVVPARFWQKHNNHLRRQMETSSKLATSSLWSPSRGVSPSRAQNGVLSGLSSRFGGGSEPSILSFAVDVSRGKVAENRIFDAYLLRLFHNRLLQWRFVNARANAALSAQTLNAEEEGNGLH